MRDGVAIPAFSIFSASSELLVTAAVFYIVWRAYTKNDFRGALLAIVLAFEALANIAYMAYRVAVPSDELRDAPAWLTSTAALHGILSLVMFLFLVFIAALAWKDNRDGTNFFREQKATTWIFVGLWTVSIASGEFLFAALYLV